jgi:2-methylcitrate dehydratase PrpD
MAESAIVATDPIDDLIAHVATRRFAQFPATAIQAAKVLLLDTLAAGVAGAATPGAAAILAARGKPNGSASTQVLGRPERLAPGDAALLNAHQIHCLEYDCVHEKAVLHPLTPLVGAVLADVESLQPISGEEFLSALILGVDVTCSIALASSVASPFFRTGSAAAFGATAACARLRGFDKATMLGALGLVYEQCGSSRQAHTEGTSIMGLLAGFAARNALLACDLAEQGVVGPRQVLTGPYGYLRLYEGSFQLAPVWHDIGTRYRIEELSQKPYPSGRPTHMFVDAVKALMASHSIHAADVARGACRMPGTVQALVGRSFQPEVSPNYAKLCTAYCVAAALHRGTLSQADFTIEAIARSEVADLAKRVSAVADDNPDPNALGPATLTLTLTNGEVIEHTVTYALGHPENPMTREQRLKKFWSCWELIDPGPGRERGEALIERIDKLETLPDVSELLKYMRPGP